MLSKSFRRGAVAALAFTVLLLASGAFDPAGAAASQCKKKCTRAATCETKTVKTSCPTGASAKGCKASCRGCGAAGACCKTAAAKMRAKHISEIKSAVTELPYHESKRLVLSGQVLCGKCQLNKFETCQTLLKTNDGKLYPLLSNNKVHKLRMTESNNGFEITARVKRLDGIKYLEVISFNEM